MNKVCTFFLIVFILASCQQSSPAELYQKATDYLTVNKLNAAEESYLVLLRIYPNSIYTASALFYLGSMYHFKLRKPDQAISYYSRLIKFYKLSPYYNQTLLSLSDLYLERGEVYKQRAIALLEVLIAKDDISKPQWAMANLRLVESYWDLLDYQSVRSLLKQMIVRIADDKQFAKIVTHAYFKIGLSYQMQGYNKLAIISYLEAEKFSDYSIDSLYAAIRLAELYEQQNNLKQSQKVYKTILQRLDPDDVLYNIYKKKVSS